MCGALDLCRILTETCDPKAAQVTMIQPPYPCLARLSRLVKKEQARKEYGTSALRQLALAPSVKPNYFQGELACNFCFRREVRLFAVVAERHCYASSR